MTPAGRRAFLRDGALVLAGAPVAGAAFGLDSSSNLSAPPLLRIGLVTDIHYADKEPAGTRFYRDALPKLEQCIQTFNEQKVDLVIELGDFIDAAEEVSTELGYLREIDAVYSQFRGPRHYVLGNHCVWTLTKPRFLEAVGAAAAHHSFDQGDVHFILLDACYRSDGVSYENRNYDWTDTDIPPEQQEWLQADLAATDLPTLVFIHQRLDVANHYGVKSGETVRRMLEASGKVRAVFQGHNHVNDHRSIGGVDYVTLAAMIEGALGSKTASSILDVYPDRLELTGFGEQTGRNL